MTRSVVEDPKLAALATAYAEREDPLPEGRSGTVTAACRAATIHRILTGKSLDSARQGVLTLPEILEALDEAND